MSASALNDPIEVAAEWFWETGTDLRFTYLSQSAEASLGCPAATLIGRTQEAIAANSGEAAFWRSYREATSARRAFREFTYPYDHPDGRTRWLRIGGEPRHGADGTWLGYRGVGIDVSTCERTRLAQTEALNEVQTANTRLLEQNRRFDAALENMSQGLTMFDADRRLVVFNQRYCEIYRLPAGTLTIGMTQREAIERILSLRRYCQDATVETLLESARASIEAGGAIPVHRELADGRIVAVTHRPMAGGGWVATFEDVTERKGNEARIAYLARYDALTDLPNRAALRETGAERIGELRHGGARLAAYGLSLRRFKLVNDGFGHAVGDTLLRAVAERLRDATQGTDTAARLAGDEFAILQAVEDADAAMTLARRLIETLAEPFAIAGQTVVVGVSIGVALADGERADIDDLLRNADLALDHARAEGADGLRLFDPEMDETARRRRAMERDLDQAFSLGQFEVHYQPIVDIGSRAVIGLEALVRWRHPHNGLVGPDAFIPVLEETGLIVPLGEWVLGQACLDAATWPRDVSIAVNVSAVQLREAGFARMVMAALAASGLAPNRLELEITESVLLQDTQACLETLHRLRRAGIRIAMDDFGTGYSSIGYLRQFPFDKIKIDQSFVRDAPTSPDALAIVRAIIGLGQSLGIRTLAEGIETEAQFALIEAEGCREMQGYLFSAARPAAEIGTMLGLDRPITRAA